jgi:uncharacterized membrane protein YphA (DoxX/SURF4 family)
MTIGRQPGSRAHQALNIALWIAQLLIAFAFVSIGWMKFSTPIAELSKMIPWAGQFPERFVRSIGLIDMAGGLGVVLPAATRILPRLTVFAALGCTVLQVLAILFHFSRGEASATPLNFVLLPLVAFILWGRAVKCPISPRWPARG